MLQLRKCKFPVVEQQGKVNLSTAYFLLAAVQVVLRRCPAERRGAVN